MSNRRLLPLAAAMIAGLGYVSSAQALFEDNDARIAINAMRKDMVTMQAQISRLENGQKASLALSDQIASLQERQSVLSGRLETLENRIAQQEKNSRDLYTDLDSRLRKLDGRVAKAETAAQNAPAGEPGSDPAAQGQAAAASNEKGFYDRGLSSFQSGQYADSVKAFSSLISGYPQSTYLPEAMYWQGNAYFALQKYKDAAAVEDRLTRQYPNSTRTPDALLSLASAQTALGNIRAANSTLTSLQKRFPKTEQAKLAAQRQKELKAALPPEPEAAPKTSKAGKKKAR